MPSAKLGKLSLVTNQEHAMQLWFAEWKKQITFQKKDFSLVTFQLQRTRNCIH